MLRSDGMETDHDLMRAVSEGDAVSFASLYDRYSPAVLALCIRILRSRADAEELLSDVFQEVWNRPERYDPARGNVLTYLITLARSRAIDRLRSRKRRDERFTSVDDGERVADEPADPGGETPLESAVLAEQRGRIRQALSDLSPDQREAIELSFYSGLSHSEISRELGQPLGTIKSRIRNGLIQLQDSLRIVYGGGEIG